MASSSLWVIKHTSGILKKYPSVVSKFKLLSNNDRIKLHWENHTSILPHIERDMIAVTGLPSILNQKEFQFVQNRKENCHHDHIPLNLKEDGNIVLWVYWPSKMPKPCDLQSDTHPFPQAETAIG